MSQEHLVLDEVRRLNLRKQELEKQISKLESWAEEQKQKTAEYEKQSTAASEACRKARREVADAMKTLSETKARTQDEKDNIDAERASLGLRLAQLEATMKESAALLSQIESSKVNAKQALQKANNAKAEAEAMAISNGQRSADLDSRQKHLAGVQSYLDKASQDLKTKSDAELAKQTALTHKMLLDSDLLLLTRKDAQRQSDDNVRASQSLKEATEKAIEREKQAVAEQSRYEALVKSMEREKAEIEQLKKSVQIDRLRLDKLAREKGLDEELKRLKNEDKS